MTPIMKINQLYVIDPQETLKQKLGIIVNINEIENLIPKAIRYKSNFTQEKYSHSSL